MTGNNILAGCGDAVRRRNPHLFGQVEVQAPTPRTRLRQSSKPLMNKLEQEWFDIVKRQHPNLPSPRPQAKTYRIGNGVRFTPDVTASIWPSDEGARETAWEVKGRRAWDDAIVKLKIAATTLPEVRWILVWKENGEWKEQIILP